MDWPLLGLLIAAIVFVASLTRSTFGFGEALVAMPLLSLLVGVKAAAAIVAINSIINATAILSTDFRGIDKDSAWRLIATALVGIPFGVVALVYVDERVAKLLLAAVVIGFAIYNLRDPVLPEIRGRKSAFLAGWIAGVLGGAYNTMGPPLVIYGTLRRWTARTFRVTLQAVFLPGTLFICATHATLGLWTPVVFRGVLCGLPSILAAALVGRWINYRLSPRYFARLIFYLLLVVGGVLILSVLFPTPAATTVPESNQGSG